MLVYVESNFVFEHALQQEQYNSCEQIIKLAASNQISLVVPAFALAEPHQALTAKKSARENLINSFNNYLSELGRSKPYREIASNFGPLVTALKNRAAEEKNGLKRTASELLATATVIPLDNVVLAFSA